MYIQIAVIIIISALFYIFGKRHTGFSILLGGVVCIVPNLYFALRLFTHTGAQKVRQIMKAFYFGEMIKFLLTIIFFYVVLKYLNVEKIPFFTGFIIAQITFWLVVLVYSNSGGYKQT